MLNQTVLRIEATRTHGTNHQSLFVGDSMFMDFVCQPYPQTNIPLDMYLYLLCDLDKYYPNCTVY
jgi:hypothetical protein